MAVSRIKPAPKAEHVVKDIRDAIISGRLWAGTRLPVRAELEQTYNVSWSTLQKAVDQLRLEGFVETRGRNGTFVADQPPHLHRYGLVFPTRPTPQWSRLLSTLQQEALTSQAGKGRRLSAYYHNGGDMGSQDYRTLLDDVVRHRVAGLIFVTSPANASNSPILTQRGVPCVGLMAPQLDIPHVSLDQVAFWRRAVEYCRNRGRRRVGIVSMCMDEADYWQKMTAIFAQAGVETRPYWTLFFAPWQPSKNPLQGEQMVANPVHAMMRLPQEQRPDALVIGDDSLVEQALAGVVASGAPVNEMEIVAHCNYPSPPPTVLPVRRLGYDCRRLLHVGCDLIDEQRRGVPVPPETWVEPVFEDELHGQFSYDRPWTDVRTSGSSMHFGITG